MSNQLDDIYLNRIKASMIDSFTDFISIANTDRKIIYYNPAAYKMMGYGPDERPVIDTTEKLHAEGFDEFAKNVIQPSVFKNGSWNGISAIRHKNGSTIVVDMTVFPLYGPNGEEYGTVAVIRDVNELTKMNQRLQKSTELFQKVLDSAKIGVVLINMETNTIEMINKFTEELLQMGAEEILGRKCYDVLCHSNLGNCPHVNEKDKKVLLGERFIKRKDGSMLPIIKTGTWITIDDKKYLVDTFVDISIQKELENNLNDAKILAETASRSKSEFLSRMSHEMRTPLTAIIGMAQIADKTSDVAKLKDCLETIKLSSNHLLGLINDILDLSKIEEGKLELDMRPFSVHLMIQKIALLINPKIKEKNLKFSAEIDPEIPEFLHGDSLRLSQVLLNFLSNAVKFTPENKTVSLAVKTVSSENKKTKLLFYVSDDGVGITGEQLSRLFTPFVQADGSITRKYGGTGLGLVISKRLINLMGSDIKVETEYGKGSKFSFEVELETAGGENLKQDDIDVSNISGIFKGKKILLVDDVDINRMIVTELLSETGAAFDEAANGKEAFEKASRAKYDAVLMDIQMPVMDGYEATRLIRKLEKPYSGVPIIAMSANVFKEDIERSLAEGMNDHTGKPVDAAKLISSLSRLINIKESGETKQSAPEKIVSFRTGTENSNFDKNYFNYSLALKNHDGNNIELAILCNEFIESDYCGKLKAALKNKDYAKAESVVKILIQKSHDFALASLASYAQNVKENLNKKNFAYAEMYFYDLEKCYAKTREIITNMLEA